MKRLVPFLLMLSLLLTSSVASAHYVKVAHRSDLNVRAEPSWDGKVVAHLFRNDYIEDHEDAGDGWTEITSGKYKGRFVRTSYLSSSRVSGGSGKAAFVTLRYRSTGAAVRTLQRNLNTIMGTKLAVNGVFDSATRTAVRDFQRAYGLTVDGVVGAKTWAKIIELR